jgi:excisionase family DNA binding protein
MKTLDIDECAEFLKVKSTVVSEMVGTGELPGARIGRAWVFLEDDLIDYVRTQIRNQRRERQSAQFEKRQDEEGRNLDQDNLTMLSTVLRNRRSPITEPYCQPSCLAVHA